MYDIRIAFHYSHMFAVYVLLLSHRKYAAGVMNHKLPHIHYGIHTLFYIRNKTGAPFQADIN